MESRTRYVLSILRSRKYRIELEQSSLIESIPIDLNIQKYYGTLSSDLHFIYKY